MRPARTAASRRAGLRWRGAARALSCAGAGLRLDAGALACAGVRCCLAEQGEGAAAAAAPAPCLAGFRGRQLQQDEEGRVAGAAAGFHAGGLEPDAHDAEQARRRRGRSPPRRRATRGSRTPSAGRSQSTARPPSRAAATRCGQHEDRFARLDLAALMQGEPSRTVGHVGTHGRYGVEFARHCV